jgi:REP element-mobilizing transposase RayT
MTRFWFVTRTTYGTWLPGDERGFVTHVRTEEGQVIHNVYGTEVDADMPGLKAYARSIMKQEAVWFSQEQAEIVARQLRETAGYRGWRLLVLAVMANHVHLVVEAAETVPAQKILGDFKSYATRALNRDFGGGKKRRWWTESGSKRPLRDTQAVDDTVEYVRQQQSALVVWTAEECANKEPAPAG